MEVRDSVLSREGCNSFRLVNSLRKYQLRDTLNNSVWSKENLSWTVVQESVFISQLNIVRFNFRHLT